MSHFVYLRATTKDVFALHCEQGRNVALTTQNDIDRATIAPGSLGYFDGTNHAGNSDYGIRWWMIFYNVPAAQWPAGIVP